MLADLILGGDEISSVREHESRRAGRGLETWWDLLPVVRISALSVYSLLPPVGVRLVNAQVTERRGFFSSSESLPRSLYLVKKKKGDGKF